MRKKHFLLGKKFKKNDRPSRPPAIIEEVTLAAVAIVRAITSSDSLAAA